MLNETAKTFAAIPSSEIKLDRQVKRVLACKPILSRILAELVEECRDMSFEEVEQCIEGDVMIDQDPVEPGFPAWRDCPRKTRNTVKGWSGMTCAPT
jgi:hypothetical protein